MQDQGRSHTCARRQDSKAQAGTRIKDEGWSHARARKQGSKTRQHIHYVSGHEEIKSMSQPQKQQKGGAAMHCPASTPPLLTGCRCSPHSSIFCGKIPPQPASISSVLMPSYRHLIWTMFSYPVSTTGRTTRIAASTSSRLDSAAAEANMSGHCMAAACVCGGARTHTRCRGCRSEVWKCFNVSAAVWRCAWL